MNKIKILLILLPLLYIFPVYAENAVGIDDQNIEAEIYSDVDNNNISAYVIIALESENAVINNTVTNIWQRPFLYKEKTYVPFNVIAEALGAGIEYNDEERKVRAQIGWHIYEVFLDSETTHIYYDCIFVPLRDMCSDLGLNIFWDEGLIAVSTNELSLTEELSEAYKNTLSFEGYSDKYYVPKTIVDPYVTYSYEQMNEDIDYLSKAYPDLIKKFSIGQSAEGRELTAFTLGNGEKNVIICASMHAREYIATNVIMYMADRYAYGYYTNASSDSYNIRELLNKTTLTIIPMVNPDGINLAQNGYESTLDPEYLSGLTTNSFGYRGWKANTNGVDLNNNFDYLWYKHGGSPSFAGYSGPYGGSEPETQAMQKYIDETEFDIFTSLHTQGQVIYWMDPNCDQSLVPKFKPHIDRLCTETGFLEMPSDGTIGYSGYMTDYIRANKKRMAMTIELCPYVGDYPYPESDFDRVYYPVRNLGLILSDISQSLEYKNIPD